jgi:hypothetical protein
MRTLLTLLLLTFCTLFMGCSDMGHSLSEDRSASIGVTTEGGSSSTGSSTGAAYDAPATAGTSEGSGDEGAAPFGGGEMEGSSSADGDSVGGEGAPLSEPSTSPDSEPVTSGPEPQAGQLTAAEWRDLDNWAFFRSLFEQNQDGEFGPFTHSEGDWSLFTAGRVSVLVHTDGEPVTNARVVLMGAEQTTLFEARTDNKGRAELFAGLQDNTTPDGLTVTVFDLATGSPAATRTGISTGSDEAIVIGLDGRQVTSAAEVLDLMFVIDTTGSMGDELAYLQKELEDVIAQVVDHNSGNLEIRLSLNFYRDNGDLYVVRSNAFTTDIDDAIDALLDESANGGGDYPEAVEEALDDAIFNHAWSDDAVARMLFFVLDAPPHHGDAIDTILGDSLTEAARLGVRMFPLAASGVDKDTEALLRLMQVATGGSYLFLTDDSGIGNPHLEPTIGEYDVELLRDLLVRLIDEQVAPISFIDVSGQIL